MSRTITMIWSLADGQAKFECPDSIREEEVGDLEKVIAMTMSTIRRRAKQNATLPPKMSYCCDCGNECVVTESNFSRTKSCGCVLEEWYARNKERNEAVKRERARGDKLREICQRHGIGFGSLCMILYRKARRS